MKPDLYLENQQLRQQLKELLARARKNEQKFARLNTFELRLLGSTSLLELARVIQDYRSYGGAEIVTLAIIDPLYEAQRTLREQAQGEDPPSSLIFFPNEDSLNRLYNISAVPKLGAFRATVHAELFPSGDRAPESVALLPLIRNGELIGSLNLGSTRKEHYTSNPSTEFLERLAAIVATCLENCMNLERIKRIGLTDPLTGINNRRFFDQRLNEEVARAVRHGGALTCLLLDLDHFKKINDTRGHSAGDHVLIGAARIMRAQLRGTDVLARYGGEEFVALLMQTERDVALDIAERIRAAIEHHNFAEGADAPLHVTLSIGLSTLEHHTEDLPHACTRLLSTADQALYAAKHAGRNQVRSYRGDGVVAI